MKRLMSVRYSDTAFNIAMLAMRLCFGLMMLFNNGIYKMTHFASEQQGFYDPLGIGSRWSLILVIFAEVFCSIFLVLGLFTRAALIPLIITMIVVVFMFHSGKPVSKLELPVMYLVAYIVLLLCGPGRFSIDGMMK
jgi:putative oxidoreductase